ncbi:MAG: polyprenyl synthetase family protein [Chloroflexi bacterium]|nr:polyprenyl synthetase family protein [Chloroflexota bacterium]
MALSRMVALNDLRGQVRDYTDRLVAQECGIAPFAQYLRSLLGLPGLLLSEHGGSGLVPATLLTFNALAPGRDPADAVPGAAAGELFYTAFQVLDKVIDDEVPQGAVDWDPLSAANAVAALQSISYVAALDVGKRGFPPEKVARCIRALSTAYNRVAETQHLDRLSEAMPDPTLDLALQITVGKSAPIDQAIGQIGAGLATDDPEVVRGLTEFAADIGIHWALVNDLNDVLPGNIHKSDVRRRKKSLPIVFFLTQTPQGKYEAEKRCLRATHPIAPEEEAEIRTALVESGAVDYTAVLAESYRIKAGKALDRFGRRFDLSRLRASVGVDAP